MACGYEPRLERLARWTLEANGTVMAGIGGNGPVVNGREVRGLEAVLKIMAAFPILTVLFTMIVSFAIYFDRLKSRWRK